MIHFQHLKRRKWFAAIDFFSVCGSEWLALYLRTKVQLPVFAHRLPDVPPYGFSSIWLLKVLLALTFVFFQGAFGVVDFWHSGVYFQSKNDTTAPECLRFDAVIDMQENLSPGFASL